MMMVATVVTMAYCRSVESIIMAGVLMVLVTMVAVEELMVRRTWWC